MNMTMNDIKKCFNILGISTITTNEETINEAYRQTIITENKQNQKNLNDINLAYQNIKSWLTIRKNNNNYSHYLSILNHLSKECQIKDISKNIQDLFKEEYQHAYNIIKQILTKINNIDTPTPSKINSIKKELNHTIEVFKKSIINTYKKHNPSAIIEFPQEKEPNYNLNNVYMTLFNILNQAETIRLKQIIGNKDNDIDMFYQQFTTRKNYLLIKNILDQRKKNFKENLLKNKFKKIDLLESFIKEKIIINRLFDQYTSQKRTNNTILQDIQTLIAYQLVKTYHDVNYKKYINILETIQKNLIYLSNNITSIDQATFEWIIDNSLQTLLQNTQSIDNLNVSLNIICYAIKEKEQNKQKTKRQIKQFKKR